MRKTIAAALAALLAACGGSTSSGDLQTQSRNAMPSSDKVKMNSPNATATTKDGSSGSLEQDSTVGSASTFFNLTVGLSSIINGSAGAVLGVLKAVTDFPATNCAGDSCTWGPLSGALDANVYQLVVTKAGDGHFTYVLSGQSKTKAGAALVPFLSGTAVPSGTPHVGSGELIIDNDAKASFEPTSTDAGKLVIDYSNTGLLIISATATGVNDNDHPGQKLNVGYQYSNTADGGGSMDVAFKNFTSLAVWSLNSRWKQTGAGRGDAKFTVGPLSATASECWATAANGFKVAFFTSTDPNQPASGNESDCAFTPASYGSVAPPQ